MLDKAAGLAPNNPRVINSQALSLFRKPSMVGGGKEKVLALMLNVEELSEKEPPSTQSWALTWGLAESQAQLVH